MGRVEVVDEESGERGTLRAGSAGSSRRRAWLLVLGTLLFSLTVFAGMWLTVTAPAGLRAWQLALGAAAVLGQRVRRKAAPPRPPSRCAVGVARRAR